MSVQSVNTLVSSILSYVGDNKQANNNIQQQVAALLGGSLTTVILDMGKGREGAILRVEGGSVELRGRAGARIFRRGQEPVEVAPVSSIESLVA